MKKWTIIILAAVIVLAIVPLLVAGGAEFGGADSGGQTAITEIDPDYTPWFDVIWNQSVTTNYVMFGLQGLVGAGLLFSALGYLVGRSRGRAEAGAGKYRPVRVGTVIAYVAVAVAAFAVVPVLYYAIGYRPPSGEIICFFFALNAAIFSGFVCFAITFFWGRDKGRAQARQAPVQEPRSAEAS
jgi:cobalt/nickel transport protein